MIQTVKNHIKGELTERNEWIELDMEIAQLNEANEQQRRSNGELKEKLH